MDSKMKYIFIFGFFFLSIAYATDISACQALNAPDTIYNLTADVSSVGTNCFDVSASNVTLECNGFNITGDNTGGTYGVYINTIDYFTARNCNISEYPYGIVTLSSNYFVLENITAIGTSGGITVNSCTFGTITNSFLNSTIMYSGIWIGGSANILVENVTMIGYDFGAFATTSTGINFINVTATGTTGILGNVGINIDRSTINNTGVGGCSLNLNGGGDITGSVINNTVIYGGTIAGLCLGGYETYVFGYAFENITFKDASAIWVFIDAAGENQFSKIKYENSYGSIYYPQTINYPNSIIINTGNLDIFYNRAYLNSTSLITLNESSEITLNGLPFSYPVPIVDYLDNGTYNYCTSPNCNITSNDGGVLVFDVSHFTSYSSVEAAPPEVTLYEPINGSSSINTPPFVFVATGINPLNCSLEITRLAPIVFKNELVNSGEANYWTIPQEFIEGNYTWRIYCYGFSLEYATSEYRTFSIGVAQTYTNTTQTYSDVTIPYTDLKTLLGLGLILLGLWGMWHYITMLIRI